MTKLCNLEVNDAGGWRRVMSFDATHDEDSNAVLDLANRLLNCGTNARLKARIMVAGDASTAPLMNWTAAAGWRQWVHPADRVPA